MNCVKEMIMGVTPCKSLTDSDDGYMLVAEYVEYTVEMTLLNWRRFNDEKPRMIHLTRNWTVFLCSFHVAIGRISGADDFWLEITWNSSRVLINHSPVTATGQHWRQKLNWIRREGHWRSNGKVGRTCWIRAQKNRIIWSRTAKNIR